MNILAIGAHYDDVELGCGGTLLNHVARGDRVTVVVATDSGYSNPAGKVIRSCEQARKEGERAAELMGAELVSLDRKTFYVTHDEALTSELTAVIEARKIHTVYSHWTGDLHRDHRRVAESALMAGRHVPRFLMYRSNFYETGEPFNGNFFSDITKVMEQKLALVRAHRSELGRVEETWITWLNNLHENSGLAVGVKYAECFRVVRWLMEGDG